MIVRYRHGVGGGREPCVEILARSKNFHLRMNLFPQSVYMGAMK